MNRQAESGMGIDAQIKAVKDFARADNYDLDADMSKSSLAIITTDRF